MKRQLPQAELLQVQEFQQRATDYLTRSAIAVVLAGMLKCVLPLLFGGIAPNFPVVFKFMGPLWLSLIVGAALTYFRYRLLALMRWKRTRNSRDKPIEFEDLPADGKPFNPLKILVEISNAFISTISIIDEIVNNVNDFIYSGIIFAVAEVPLLILAAWLFPQYLVVQPAITAIAASIVLTFSMMLTRVFTGCLLEPLIPWSVWASLATRFRKHRPDNS